MKNLINKLLSVAVAVAVGFVTGCSDEDPLSVQKK